MDVSDVVTNGSGYVVYGSGLVEGPSDLPVLFSREDVVGAVGGVFAEGGALCSLGDTWGDVGSLETGDEACVAAVSAGVEG